MHVWAFPVIYSYYQANATSLMCIVGLVYDLQILSGSGNLFEKKSKYDAVTSVTSCQKSDLSQWGRTIASMTTGAPCLFMLQDKSGMKEASKHRQEDESGKADCYLTVCLFVVLA